MPIRLRGPCLWAGGRSSPNNEIATAGCGPPRDDKPINRRWTWMNTDGEERLTLNVRSERFGGGPLRANALDPSCWEKRRATKGCAARMDARKQDVTPAPLDLQCLGRFP
jgi:hypothetical protein